MNTPESTTAREAGPARLVVALDGPGSSGKSTVGAAAAAALGYRFVDTGLLYRALTALALRQGVRPEDTDALVGLVGRVSLADGGDGRLTRVLLDDADATDQVQRPDVDEAVSAFARVPEVRSALLPRQRALAEGGRIVVAGRDIGTVVLPDADLKLYLDASVAERAARRIQERGLDPESPEAGDVRAALRARDERDSSRTVAPLRPADDARRIHTDGNRFEDTVALVVAEMRAAEAGTHGGPESGPLEAESSPASAPGSGTGTRRDRARDRGRPIDPNDPALANDKSVLVRMVAIVTRILIRACARLRIEGIERIPRTGAVILAGNHISNIDPMIVGAWITPLLRRRRIHWLGKRELFDWPIFGWIAAHGGVHPVDRSTADVEAYRLATRILENGWVLTIFPEGTRSPTGALQEAKDGLATLAMRTGATIVPIGINNSDAVWPKGRKLPSPFPRRTITVRIGEPFTTAGLVPPGTDRRAAKGLATVAIMRRIAALLDERHRGVYGEASADPGPANLQ